MDQNDLEALLASLRQAQDGSLSAAAAPFDAAPPPPTPDAPPTQEQLDSLLSSLTALPATAPTIASVEGRLRTEPMPSRNRDLSALSFAEAVPILNGRANDPRFLKSIQEMWDTQENWELRMKDQRNRLERELAAASPILRSSKLREWDRDAARKWTTLQGEQQEQLKALGVPTFQKTDDATIRKRQERVTNVLVGLLEDRNGGE